MPFPEGWNRDTALGPEGPRKPSDRHSISAFKECTTTADFDDNAYLWIDIPGANPFKPTLAPTLAPLTVAPFGDLVRGGVILGTGYGAVDVNQPNRAYPAPPPQPKPVIFCSTMWIKNDSAEIIEVSINGTDVFHVLLANEEHTWREFYVAGIAVRFKAGSAAGDCRIAAW